LTNAATEWAAPRRRSVVAVPQQLLFELNGIDLDAVFATAEEVGRTNPQAGHMRQLDHVIWMADDHRRILGVKQVRDDEFWVPGHIPGRPLMPGVLMIEAAAQLSSFMFRARGGEADFLGFTRCTDTVFRGQVVPGDTLLILVEEVIFGRKRFTCRGQGVVDGRLAFETTVTGMVF